MFIMNTHDDLMIFTNKGKVFSIKGYEVPMAQRTARGRAIVNLIQIGDDDKVAVTLPLKENRVEGYLMLATLHGKIKKTPLSEFANIRSSGKIAIKLLDGDELIGAAITEGNDDMIIAASSGKCIRFNEANVREQGRDTMGVRSISLGADDHVVDMTVLKPDMDIITISEKGYGKRTDQADYTLQGRAGKGLKAGVFNDKTGMLVNLKQLPPDMDIMLITDNGTIIRMSADEISKIGRNTQGVRLMKIKDESKIVGVALAPKGEEEPEGAEGTTDSTDTQSSES
jgi:DNA gyrase subunit A